MRTILELTNSNSTIPVYKIWVSNFLQPLQHSNGSSCSQPRRIRISIIKKLRIYKQNEDGNVKCEELE